MKPGLTAYLSGFFTGFFYLFHFIYFAKERGELHYGINDSLTGNRG